MGAIGEKLKAIPAWLKKIPKKIMIIIGVLIIAMVVAIIAFVANRPYSVLVTGVSAQETSSVLTFLENQGVTDYKVENSDTILVPSAQEPALKAKLMMENYPQSGFGYSLYYENVGALSTESERREASKHLLQERLGAVIREMDNVKDAVVTINLGQDRGYVLDSGNVVDATAGVLVTMQSGTKLNNKQAEAIRNVVAHGIEGLKIGKVYITDTAGNSYNTGGEESHEGASSLKLQLEEEWERKIRTEVLQVLTPFFGEGNVHVGVNCVVEVSHVTENRHDVILPPYAQDGSTGGRGPISAEQNSWYLGRPGEEGAGGIVGSTTNSDLPTHVEDLADPDGTENVITGSSQKDYDNSQSDKQIITTAGTLKDCTISVSINTQGNSGQVVDVAAIQKHVARAAGIQGIINPDTQQEDLNEKISVMTMDFYTPPTSIIQPNGVVPTWVLLAAGAGLLLFILILILILVLRKRRKKKREREEAAAQAAAMLANDPLVQQQVVQTGADIMTLQSEKNMELRKDIRQFASDNPEIAAQMVRGWLRGGDDNG